MISEEMDKGRKRLIKSAISTVSSRRLRSNFSENCCCSWAANNGMYIPRQVLAARIIDSYLPTMVVDVRDGDISGGGMIRGALYCPEDRFGVSEIHSLIEKAKELRRRHNTGISNHRCLVVFHCSDSRSTRKRSPRCARKFVLALKALGETNLFNVKLLEGGTDAWMRSYWHDPRLVEAFDGKYWSFYENVTKRKDCASTDSSICSREHKRQKSCIPSSPRDPPSLISTT